MWDTSHRARGMGARPANYTLQHCTAKKKNNNCKNMQNSVKFCTEKTPYRHKVEHHGQAGEVCTVVVYL